MQDGQYELVNNEVVIKGKVKDKGDLTYNLETLYKQRTNRNYLLFFSREKLWFRIQNKEPKGWLGRFWRKSITEKTAAPPAIYSDSLTDVTVADMERYLHYIGYFNGEVIPQREGKRQRMRVRYFVRPGERFIIDSVNFASTDPEIEALLQNAKDESVFQPGAPLNLELFGTEKRRITNHLREYGYAQFYPAQIADLQIDTFQNYKRGNLYINAQTPYGDSLHRQFFIGEIDVFPDYTDDSQNIVRDTSIAGLHFYLSERGYVVDRNTLRRAISLRPGELYRTTNETKTFQALDELGIFRFVRIKPYFDADYPDVINFQIQLTPNYLMEFDASFEVNYTNRPSSSLSNNLFGTSVSPVLIHRNLFGGAELLRTSLRAGGEIAPNDTLSLWNTVDLGAEFNLQLPSFRDYFGLWKNVYRRITGPSLYSKFKKTSTTSFLAKYDYLNILRWYRLHSMQLSYGYRARLSNLSSLNVDHFAINLLNPSTEPDFDQLRAENDFLDRSFGRQLFVSLLFRDFNYNRRKRPSARGQTSSFNWNVEVAGAEVLGANQLYNFATGESDTFRLFTANRSDTIEISQYAKTSVELRYLKPTSSTTSFATRVHFGIAVPYGNTGDVPYVKQLFAGGANSMRAWPQRGLGPGGFQDPLANNPENNFRLFQTGNIKLEMNAEYRFPIFLYLKGAVFLDVGNIWTLEADEERPGAQFLFKRGAGENEYPFYRQLAVAGGLGFRLDVSYFILRFDVGARLRNTFPRETLNPSEADWWNNWEQLRTNNLGYNLGLGMPF
ncbi:MAG: BamA/TamA family outer membrane protein [Bacteroidota bacterium]